MWPENDNDRDNQRFRGEKTDWPNQPPPLNSNMTALEAQQGREPALAASPNAMHYDQ